MLKPTGPLRYRLLPLLATILAATLADAGGPRFEVRFTPEVRARAYSGRVYVMTVRDADGKPLDGPDWFDPEPFFALDVADLAPGATVTLAGDDVLGHPCRLADLPAGEYRAQAVIDINGWRRNAIKAPGNGYSSPVRFSHDPAAPEAVRLEIDRTVDERKYEDSARVRYVFLNSRRLSAFHGRNVELKAAVLLPEAYDESETRRFPAIYDVPGFGGSIDSARWQANFDPYAAAGVDIVRVILDPEAPTGHHVFADSANNGPVGAALVHELIPHLEREFRLIAEPGARFLTGGSSGGWSSLWLQIAYPDTFGGVWSLCPDPVDFHAFQNVDIYDETANFYFNADGSPKECSRPTSMGHILVKQMCDMEHVLGRGGQYQSFEAVFSPIGTDGRPRQLWDRETGRIDREVAAAWRKYDITALLADNWEKLGPQLAGKLHIICGDTDTFYLEKAVYRLRDRLAELGSDAEVTIIPGGTHFLGPPVTQQVAREVAETFREFEGR